MATNRQPDDFITKIRAQLDLVGDERWYDDMCVDTRYRHAVTVWFDSYDDCYLSVHHVKQLIAQLIDWLEVQKENES